MDRPDEDRTRLARLLAQVAAREGTHPTPVPGVEVTRRAQGFARKPVAYPPNIIVVGQGRKRGYLGDEVLPLDPFNYLVLSVPIPFECEASASPEEPLLVVTVSVEPALLGELLLEMDEAGPPAGPPPRGIYSSPLTEEVSGAVIRLLECLRSTLDSRVLGRQAAREVVYRVLRGEHGTALRALAGRNEQFTRVARVLRLIHADYSRQLGTEDLAKRAGMSVSAFHHNFKAVTGSSPLQYLKRVRLHRARMLMAHGGHNANTAGVEVGYRSPSQFSREYRRLFGVPPHQDVAALRAEARPAN